MWANVFGSPPGWLGAEAEKTAWISGTISKITSTTPTRSHPIAPFS
jgi:hypothetical protein